MYREHSPIGNTKSVPVYLPANGELKAKKWKIKLKDNL